MSDRSGARDLTAALTVAASRPLPDVLLDIAGSPQTLAMLAFLWSCVAWLGTQVPQLHAAGMATDGLPRSELLALHALGLDNLAWSLVVCLLAGLTVFAALTALLMGRSRGQRGAVLLAIALPVVAGYWLWTTTELPVALDVTVGADLATVPAWRSDGGGPAPAPGRWQASCRARAGLDSLACKVEGAGLRHEVILAPGMPAVNQGVQFTWLATATAPLPPNLTLNWQAKLPDSRVFALTLADGVLSEAPSMAARLQPSVAKETGPFVLVSDGAEHPTIRVLASPELLPQGRPSAQVTGEPLIRLQVAPSGTVAPLLLAFLGLAAAFYLGARQSHPEAN